MTTLSRGARLLPVALLALAACSAPEATSRPDPSAASAATTTTSTTTSTTADAYGEGWSAVHADAANSDRAAGRGADALELAWSLDLDGDVDVGALEWTINLGPTSDADGGLYLTSTVGGCHLRRLDAGTGATTWCAEELGLSTVVSSPLLDREGRLFVADGEAMHALAADGSELWSTPIVGVPLSAQFTPAGRVVFVTHVGVVHVLDRATGRPVAEPLDLVPDPTWDPAQGLWECARGTEGCPSANTPAVDLATGRLFFTWWEPGAPAAGVRAMEIDESGGGAVVTPLWSNDQLPGGSASSPTLSPDGSRVYVTDNEGSVHALDAATGASVWTFPIGVAAGGSLSVSSDGLLVPAGGSLLAIRDDGSTGTLAWRHDDVVVRGIVTQAGGDRAYATVRREAWQNDLVVVDTATGEIIDREPLPGATVFSVGITVGPDGTVFVPMITGQLFAFVPGQVPGG